MLGDFGTKPGNFFSATVRPTEWRTYLDTSWCHLQLICELFPQTGVRLLVILVNVFEDFELRARRALAVLDLVGLIPAR